MYIVTLTQSTFKRLKINLSTQMNRIRTIYVKRRIEKIEEKTKQEKNVTFVEKQNHKPNNAGS